MPLKKDILQITGIFAILIIFLIFGGFYVLQGAYIRSALLLGSMVPLFVLMVMKGKSMKKEYPEEYE